MSNDVTNCPFCGPAIESAVFAERGAFRALYNIAPILPGHSLVVPKAHRKGVLDLSDDEVQEFFLFARDITLCLRGVFNSSGFNWTIQDGVSAGQTVPHLHLHLIPRVDGDLPHPGDWYPILRQHEQGIIDDTARPKLSEEQLRVIVDHLREEWLEN